MSVSVSSCNVSFTSLAISCQDYHLKALRRSAQLETESQLLIMVYIYICTMFQGFSSAFRSGTSRKVNRCSMMPAIGAFRKTDFRLRRRPRTVIMLTILNLALDMRKNHSTDRLSNAIIGLRAFVYCRCCCRRFYFEYNVVTDLQDQLNKRWLA
jgi:hypothetical protein